MVNRLFIFIIAMFGMSFAEVKLYGSLQYEYGYELSQQKDSTGKYRNSSHSAVNKFKSHIGIRGQHEIGNGTQLIYEVEQEVVNNKDVKSSYWQNK